MNQEVSLHGWSPEALFNKALLYVGEMERCAADHWQHRFWASLSIELLARAALAGISPTLLADRNDWRNVHYALGHPPTATKFAPKSINASEVLRILRELVPEFTKELHEACVEQGGYRNVELHSGEDVFTASGTSTWLPQYYASCDVLLRAIGKALDDLFSDAKSAREMIGSLKDAAAKSVGKDIHDSKDAWAKKSEQERAILVEQATAWATRHDAHRAQCPSCGSPARLHGARSGPVSTDIREDLVIQTQTMLPSTFECIACRLKIAGFSKLSACGLGDAFVSTTTLTPAEYFGLYTERDLDEARASAGEPEFEEDFND